MGICACQARVAKGSGERVVNSAALRKQGDGESRETGWRRRERGKATAERGAWQEAKPGRNKRRKKDEEMKVNLSQEQKAELDEMWESLGVTSEQKRKKLVTMAEQDPLFADEERLQDSMKRIREEFEQIGGPSNIQDIARMVAISPKVLSNYSPESLARKAENLFRALRREDAERVMLREPQALFVRSDNLAARLQAVTRSLPNADAGTILVRHPRLLTIPMERTLPAKLQRLEGTLGQFGITKEGVQKLVESHPSLLLVRIDRRAIERLEYVEHLIPSFAPANRAAIPLVLKVKASRLRRIEFLQECYPGRWSWSIATVLNRSEMRFDAAFPGFPEWLHGEGCSTPLSQAAR